MTKDKKKDTGTEPAKKRGLKEDEDPKARAKKGRAEKPVPGGEKTPLKTGLTAFGRRATQAAAALSTTKAVQKVQAIGVAVGAVARAKIDPDEEVQFLRSYRGKDEASVIHSRS